MDGITTMVAKIKRIMLVAKINAFGCNASTTISKLVKIEGHIFMVQALE
jgi:alanine racemase